MFVKICGLSTAVDVAAAVAAGADALGFVLTESPRRVEPGLVRELVAAVPEEVLTVAVFREEPAAYVREAVRAAGVRAVQLHGSHPAGAFAELSDLGLPLVRATSAAKAAGADCGDFGEDLLLLDAPVPGAGEPWDWAELGARPPAGKWLLAGGLGLANVRAAIAAANPWGVDVSSGVEVRRGVKDPDLIAEFVHAAKSR
ncbi:phosphoribosylanthranilate isomerase [Kitasatospora purpeofusca]|uniref:phosphoribosylanthranilate isomerase n=1 Tax=Kitasatospora purpeofusca TaxID=67352 RepID=UPI00386882D8|nr:phosphoribosylanthranilate isomerase [Kitasatospora purpeofusca]